MLKITCVCHAGTAERADDKAIYFVRIDDSMSIRKSSSYQFGFNGVRLVPDDPIVVPIDIT